MKRAGSAVRCGLLTGVAASFLVAATVSAQTQPFRNPALAGEERITNLLSLMTTDEKVNALGGFSSGVARLGVPSFGMSEGIHGVVSRGNPPRVPPITTTQFPQPPGMGSSWDPELVRRAGGVEGAEGRYITQTPTYKTLNADALGTAGRPGA